MSQINNINSITFHKNKSFDSTHERYNVNEFKVGVVVDVILDEEHPYFKSNRKIKYGEPTHLISKNEQIPANYKGEPPNSYDIDYTYIGRAKIRIIGEDIKTSIDALKYAIPIDNTITQYPLLNELVLVTTIQNVQFYSKPLNRFNYLGSNSDFSMERSYGLNDIFPFEQNKNNKSYLKHPLLANESDIGYLGKNFIINPNIRKVKSQEGDSIIESRFGQSIRFSAYDPENSNSAVKKSSSYVLNKNLYQSSKDGSYGNPKIVIRNRQRNIARDTKQSISGKLPDIDKISEKERNYGGLIEEDINHDGTTIEIISGTLSTKWKSSVYKSIFCKRLISNGENSINIGEEQLKFSPEGCTDFQFPNLLDGDQILINSDRIVLSSRFGESFHFSKKRYSVVTDSEFTIDAHDQIVMTTNTLTCFNSPQIFLGQYGETNEPALLGQTTVDWLYDLCDWLLDHTHWYDHVHPHPHTHVDAGEILSSENQNLYESSGKNTNNSDPNKTQLPVQQDQLKLLRDSLHTIMSRRVFLTGGGYALGSDGVKPTGSGGDCKDPVKINTGTGKGVVGDFKGKNRRISQFKVEFVSD